jgi:hypothetical protein
MMLNEQLSFHDARYSISRTISYDVELSFNGLPSKERLEAHTTLVRLDFPVVFGIFAKVWWMRESVLQALVNSADPGSSALRQEWQHQQALPKASRGTRTQVFEIELTTAVFAWVGRASPLFHKKGGAEQIYLPNLASGTGADRSGYARLRRTYILPV